MRETQEAHMMDRCVIYRVTGKSKNSRGVYVPSFDDGTESICGLMMQPMALSSNDKYQLADIDAVLRLPHGVTVRPKDEIEITARFGEVITPQRYEVDRYLNEGPSGSRAYLKATTIV